MKWTIRNKMLVAFGGVLALLITQLAVNWHMSNSSIQLSEEARDKGYGGAHLATELQLELVQVQQWLTDISATQAAEGFDDGFDEAATHAELFRESLEALMALHPDDARYCQVLWMERERIQRFQAAFFISPSMN